MTVVLQDLTIRYGDLVAVDHAAPPGSWAATAPARRRS
jgi:hypothetical protein